LLVLVLVQAQAQEQELALRPVLPAHPVSQVPQPPEQEQS
jgi:hypothetical protein